MNFTAAHFGQWLLKALGIEHVGDSKEFESPDVGRAAGSDRRQGNPGPGSGGTD